ncbi:hypothetical protein AYO44_05400 [Planctomycetaceae bacterium SCGC AG-212-F19]|nr:hypothetical protein AYO44_05400 [Planctomycetaceae bacterium SCGC AG-212-F19]
MWTIWRNKTRSFCDGLSRRHFLKVGALTMGGLSLADLLRLKAKGAARADSGAKAVIMIYLPGGPSHLDMYDMKPDAPAEIRGEFQPIRTSVPGFDICELMPLQAKIADKLAVIRGFKTRGGHNGDEMTTGFPTGDKRPAFGSVVSRVQGASTKAIPPYVSMNVFSNLEYFEQPAYLGLAHKPFSPSGPDMANLRLPKEVTLERLADRRTLLHSFDNLSRDLDDAKGSLAGIDGFTAQALEMVASPKARAAFDLSQEPDKVRANYGPGSNHFLLARRLVEAGVRVVSLSGGWIGDDSSGSTNLSNWDTHKDNFPTLRRQLPRLDRALYALITDLHERGLDQDVAILVGGEMGRSPRVGISNPGSQAASNGRDHWPTGFALMAGGGLRTGQVIGATDRYGERSKGLPDGPQNVLATLYHVLGIDPAMTLPDYNGRPQYLLEERDKIAELV